MRRVLARAGGSSSERRGDLGQRTRRVRVATAQAGEVEREQRHDVDDRRELRRVLDRDHPRVTVALQLLAEIPVTESFIEVPASMFSPGSPARALYDELYSIDGVGATWATKLTAR